MKLNKYIDHTLLKPDAQQEQIEKLIEENRDTTDGRHVLRGR